MKKKRMVKRVFAVVLALALLCAVARRLSALAREQCVGREYDAPCRHHYPAV